MRLAHVRAVNTYTHRKVGRFSASVCMQQVWQWPADDDSKGGAEFFDAESFRNFVEEQHLDPELKALLPKDPPGTRPIEKPAEAALRQRMCAFAFSHSSMVYGLCQLPMSARAPSRSPQWPRCASACALLHIKLASNNIQRHPQTASLRRVHFSMTRSC